MIVTIVILLNERVKICELCGKPKFKSVLGFQFPGDLLLQNTIKDRIPFGSAYLDFGVKLSGIQAGS